MRALTVPFLLLLALDAAVASQEADELHVVAKLVSVEQSWADCGVVLVGTTATYLVAEGPTALNGKQISVVVPCVEMPRTMFSKNGGDLEAFVPGQTHHLAVTKHAPHRFDAPAKLPDDPNWFYLKAASLKPL